MQRNYSSYLFGNSAAKGKLQVYDSTAYTYPKVVDILLYVLLSLCRQRKEDIWLGGEAEKMDEQTSRPDDEGREKKKTADNPFVSRSHIHFADCVIKSSFF